MLKKSRMTFNLMLKVLMVTFILGSATATINTEDFPSKLTESLPDTSKLASIPKNEDIFELINSLKETLENLKQNPQLDEKTKKLITSLERIMESMKFFIKEKNYDEGIQKFIEHAANISSLIAEEAKGKTGQILEDLQQYSLLVPKLNRLVVNVLTSSEFRKILWSTLHSFSDIYSKVSNNVQTPSFQSPRRLLKRTLKDASQGAENFKEDVKEGVQKTDLGRSDVDDIKNAAQQAINSEGEEGVDELKDAAKETAQKATRATRQVAGEVKEAAQRTYDDKADDLKKDAEAIKESAQETKDEVQRTAQQAFEIARQEGRKLFLERIQPLLQQITTHRQYREAVSEIQDLFDYFRNLKDNEVTSISQNLQQELRSLNDEATDLISRFTNGRNLKNIKASFWKLYNELYIDQQTSRYFSDVSALARDIVSNPAKYSDFSKVQNVFSDIYDRGTSLVQDKYGQQFSELSTQIGQVFDDFSNQKLTTNIRQGLELASQISPLHALAQLRTLATPYLKNFTNQIKLPPMEGKDGDTYYKVENIIFKIDESKLEDILLQFTVGLKDKIIVELKLSDLELTFRDVHFRYENKYLKDEGIMDVNVRFPSWLIHWGLEDGDSLFGDSTVAVQLDTLDITIQQADHKIIDKVALGLFSSWIKESVRVAIERSLKEPASSLAQMFNNFITQNKEFLQNQFISSETSEFSILPRSFQTRSWEEYYDEYYPSAQLLA